MSTFLSRTDVATILSLGSFIPTIQTLKGLRPPRQALLCALKDLIRAELRWRRALLEIKPLRFLPLR